MELNMTFWGFFVKMKHKFYLQHHKIKQKNYKTSKRINLYIISRINMIAIIDSYPFYIVNSISKVI